MRYCTRYLYLYSNHSKLNTIMKNFPLVIFAVFFLFSCKSDTNNPTKTSANNLYQTALDNLTTDPSKEAAIKYIDALKSEIASTEDALKKRTLYMKGLSVAEEYKLGATAIGFLMPLLKENPNNQYTEDYIAKLASALQDIGKSIPGDVLIYTYKDRFPSGKYLNVLKEKKKEKILDIEKHLDGLAEKIFEKPDKFGINKLNAQNYVDACEAFALGNPISDLAPSYLYRAAEMARTLKTFPKALNIYDWIEDKYPNYEKTATTLFLKGFMYENELKDKKKAKEVYNNFLNKYPENKLVADVKFLLENIDKTDEEIMKMIDQKNN